jgi:AcrR family transcriptional regulator
MYRSFRRAKRRESGAMSEKNGSERRLTTRGAATRRRIVAAAADLATKRGVGETSLDDVMEASGASKSQLYHYFADKDALLREAAALQAERVLAAHGPLLDALDSLAAMRVWRDAVLALNRRTGCPLGALVYQLPPSARRARTTVEDGLEAWRGMIEDGLARMQSRGELAPDAAPADMAFAVLSAVQGGLLLSRSAKSDRPLELAFDMALAHVAAQVRRPADRSLAETPRSR